ncbi:hypothetical protein [Bacteroides fragilis]|uniref:hypothetical protein n=1 Tax=Bacteroides fragilis TaxID=817 RepID=UPI003704630C|nr:hypothetical protein [Bacteroides fragilis]MCE8651255.1 hypothetical protein [Bacteroides fragilis]
MRRGLPAKNGRRQTAEDGTAGENRRRPPENRLARETDIAAFGVVREDTKAPVDG